MSAFIIISVFEETDPDTGTTTNGLSAVDDKEEVVVAVLS